MNLTLVSDMLEEVNPEAVLYIGCESALVGVAQRCGQPALAIYDFDLLVKCFVLQGLDYDTAVEHIQFNLLGGWNGPGTPIIMTMPSPFNFEPCQQDEHG